MPRMICDVCDKPIPRDRHETIKIPFPLLGTCNQPESFVACEGCAEKINAALRSVLENTQAWEIIQAAC